MNFHDRDTIRAVPANVEAEQIILGSLLVNNSVFDIATRLLEVDHFHEPMHRVIFEQAGKMLAAGKPVTPITIKSYLPAEVKGLRLEGEPATVMQYLARLASEAMPASAAYGNVVAVFDAWLARQALSVAETAVDTLLTLDPGQSAIDQLVPIEERITELRALQMRSEKRKGAGVSYLDQLTAAYQRGDVRGVPICLDEIAQVLSEPCLEAGNLYGLLSSSGEGKTALTVQIISHALRQGHPVLFMSFDQSSEQIVRQMIAQEHSIEARRQRNPQLLSEKEWATCVEFAGWIDKQPFEIIKCTNHGAAQLVGFARTFVKRNANGKDPLIVVDHIQSVAVEDKRADPGTQAKQKNQLFKAGAETTGSAWLVLNQRNSRAMERENPRPIAADLYGGEAARYDYDAIFYLYRYLKFYKERLSIASKPSDHAAIARVFPSDVREGGQDIAQLGGLKIRFGSPDITADLRFEARLTRYHSMRPVVTQEELL